MFRTDADRDDPRVSGSPRAGQPAQRSFRWTQGEFGKVRPIEARIERHQRVCIRHRVATDQKVRRDMLAGRQCSLTLGAVQFPLGATFGTLEVVRTPLDGRTLIEEALN